MSEMHSAPSATATARSTSTRPASCTVLSATAVPDNAAQLDPARTADGPVETFVEPSEPFTRHLRRVGAFGLVLLAGVSALAVLFPPAVGPTPVAGIEVTRPLWVYWWMYTLENWFG